MKTSLHKNRSLRRVRGFTLPELIGTIIIIGVIAAVAGVQVLNANAQARENAKYGNAQALNRVCVSAIAGGAAVGSGATNNIDTTTNLTAIAKLNTGFTVGGITYQVAPVVQTAASYPFVGSPTATSVVFTYTTGAAASP
jgi:prepilin-type N-terminal cleavage/methylation domain-containing protein